MDIDKIFLGYRNNGYRTSISNLKELQNLIKFTIKYYKIILLYINNIKKKEINSKFFNGIEKKIWLKHLNSARQRCRLSAQTNPKYKSYNNIIFKLKDYEILQLWIRDKAWELKKPSIDRINTKGNYTFENCRFIELSENVARENRIKIAQYDLNGKFIRYFNSIIEAEEKTNICQSQIGNCALNKRCKSAGGFQWKYYIGNKSNISLYKQPKWRGVDQFSLDGVFIKSWDSISHAAKSLNICRVNLRRAALRNKPGKAGRFRWKIKPKQ